jgi:hypothetical protein
VLLLIERIVRKIDRLAAKIEEREAAGERCDGICNRRLGA